MRSEHTADAGRFERLLETQPVILHQHPSSFNTQEGGMSFVHMINGRLAAHFLERSEAPNAQYNLLANPLMIVAAIELVGNLAIFRRCVKRDVGVEQVQGD